MSKQTSQKSAFILLTILFFLWGFITVLVDSLIPRIRELFTLSYAQAILVQFAFFGAYFILSIPASSLISKLGYKKGVISGLVIMAIGCVLFYPAASFRAFSIFLLAYFILAGGITILQVAANPYISALGDENKASSRLNLAQAFNALGTTIAPAIGALFLLSDSIKTETEIALLSPTAKETYLLYEAEAVQLPFLGLAIIILFIAVVFLFTKLPQIITEESSGTYAETLKNKNLILGVIGIFCYVGAEVSIGSFLVNYFQSMDLAPLLKANDIMMSIANTVAKLFNKSFHNSDDKALLGLFVSVYWFGAMVGRFIGAYLTRVFKPSKVLSLFSVSAILLLIISVNTNGLTAMWSILLVGLFNSIMFPTIFTLAINGSGKLKAKGSGLLCTAIVGGAIIPFIVGVLIDSSGFGLGFIFIILCYAYILFYGIKNNSLSLQS